MTVTPIDETYSFVLGIPTYYGVRLHTRVKHSKDTRLSSFNVIASAKYKNTNNAKAPGNT